MKVASVTVGIPTLNSGERFKEVLAALSGQSNAAGVDFEILVVDSGSSDGTPEAAEAAGARVIGIDKSDFQHGRTRNLIVSEAKGTHVALITDDAVPATDRWLDSLVEAFELADDVALVFGPQIPVPDHPHYVRREYVSHFSTWENDENRPDVQQIEQTEEGRAHFEANRSVYTFFAYSNGAIAKWAWQEHPYKEVPYAEDQLMGIAMIEAGHAKVFHPGFAVVHSHDYGAIGQFKRYFDDYRGLLEVMGYRTTAGLRASARSVVGLTREDRGFLRHEGVGGAALLIGTLGSLRQHTGRVAAEWLAARADRMPDWLTKRLSYEGRAGVVFYKV